MPIQARNPSYADCVAKALSNSALPLSIDELLQEIAKEREIGAGARSAIYRAINKLFQAVQVAPGVFGWISNLLTENTVRHQLSTEETRRGYILLDELEHIVFYPEFFQRYRPENRQVTVELFGGPTLTGSAAIERKTWSLRLGHQLARWIDDLGGQSGDDLIIGVMDAREGRYTMRLQPHEIRDEVAIRARNMELARLAEELVIEDRRTRPAVPAWELAAKLIGRGVYAQTPPVDDLHYVLHEYSALRLTDGLGYQTDFSSKATPHARRFDSPSPATHDDDLGGTGNEGRGNEGNLMLDQPYNDDRSEADENSDEPDDIYGKDFFLNNRFEHGQHDDRDERAGDGFLRDTGNGGFGNSGFGHNGFGNGGFGGNGFDDNGDDDECEIYAQYLQIFSEHRRSGEQPLSHEDFHLLEAELELLVRLEQEFGRLLSEQERRKLDLADQLFIDPNSLADMDWDLPDGEDYEDPPFWQN